MSISSNIRAGAAYVEVTAETSKLQRNLTQAQAQLYSFGRTATAIGRDLMVAAGAMAVPLALSVKSFANFDDQMRLVRAVTKATEDDFESLTKTAQKLGRETSFTASQVAQGMTSLGRMGFSPQEIQSSIQPVLDLARATGTELGEASNIAANSMRIFGVEASKMSSVVDVLTAAANGSAQTLTDLFEGLKMTGPQAKAAGENIQDTAAALGVLANLGIKGSLAGTALRKSYSRFAKVKVREKLKEVGVETADANGNLRKMADIMADLGKVMNDLPTAEKLAFAEDIFDIRGSLAGLSLGGNTKELDAFIAKLKDIDGTARQTASEMDAGLGGSFRLFRSAVEGAMNAIGKALEGTLQPFVDKLTSVTLAVVEWIEANQSMVTGFAVAVAGAAALGAGLVAIGMAAKAASAGISVVQGVLQGFTFVQGLFVAKGTAMGSSISLLTQAFANYRNAAMPAMVGTSKLLAALNLPIDSRAKQIAAGLILMNKAETASTAKSMLAAKWAAATTSMKNFSLATVAATATTKANTAASIIATGISKALAGAKAFAAGAIGLFSAANIKAAAVATAGGATNLFLAVTTKAVAAGYLAASAAAAAFCAIPVSWILIGIGAALAGVVIALSQAGKYTAQLTDKMSKLREKGDQQRQSDQLRMERLQQLAGKQKLSNAEMAEAEKLSGELQKKYGDLGISVDKVGNKLSIAAGAQGKLNEAMKKASLAELDAEMAEIRANLKELGKENEALQSYWNNNLWSQMSGRQQEAMDKLEVNSNKAAAMRTKLGALRQRKKAIEGGDQKAVTGEDGKSTQDKVEEHKTQSKAAKDAADDAAKRVADIDKQLARERQTELQNEIADIIALRDEYKQLIKTMLDFEKSKADDKQDKKKIAELEGKLAEADRTANQRVKEAQGKAREKMEKDVADYQNRFASNEKSIKQRRTEQAQDRKIDETLENDKGAGIEMLQGMIEQYRQAAEAAKIQFQEELKKAQADGTIDDKERAKLDNIQAGYSQAESMLDKYEGKLREAQDGTQQVAEDVKPQGAFLAAALSNIGESSAADRTAKATESVASNTKKTNDLIKKNSGMGVFT